MTKVVFSKHMIKDRVDRYMTIATKVGIGEVLYTEQQPHQDTNSIVELNLTSTGVCIIKDIQTQMIVTMYCITLAKIKQNFHLDKLPTNLYNIVMKNQKRGYCNI